MITSHYTHTSCIRIHWLNAGMALILASLEDDDDSYHNGVGLFSLDVHSQPGRPFSAWASILSLRSIPTLDVHSLPVLNMGVHSQHGRPQGRRGAHGGTAHALVIWPPPIFWEVVLGDERESLNRVKKRCRQGIFSEIVLFLVKKRSFTTFNRVKIWRVWKKEWENLKNLVDD